MMLISRKHRNLTKALATLSFLALLFLVVFTPFISLAAEESIDDINETGIVPCGDSGERPCDYNTLIEGVQRLLTFLVYFAGIVAIIMFIWAGGLLLFSGGNSSKITQAKSIFKGTVIGFIFVIGAWLIVSTIIGFFGGDGTNGSQNIQDTLPLKGTQL